MEKEERQRGGGRVEGGRLFSVNPVSSLFDDQFFSTITSRKKENGQLWNNIPLLHHI